MIPLQVQGNKLLSLVINLYNAHWSSLGGTQFFFFIFGGTPTFFCLFGGTQ